MLRSGLVFLSLSSAIGLGGCASVIPFYDLPLDERNGKPTVRSIVERIYCELEDISEKSTLEGYLSDAYDIQAGIEINLTVTDDGTLSPSFTGMSGVLSFTSGIKLEQSRAQNFAEQLFFSMRSIKRGIDTLKKTGDYDEARRRCSMNADTNLSGKLGLKEAFDLAITSGTSLDWTTKAPTGVFGGSITFIVDKEITATGPTWRLVNFSGPGSFLTASNKNTDKLTFAFVRGKNAGVGLDPDLKFQTQAFISDIRQGQIANSLAQISTTIR